MVGRYVTSKLRNMIVDMRVAGLLLSEIAIIVDRSKSTISRIIKN
jgi:IS30 family transposase